MRARHVMFAAIPSLIGAAVLAAAWIGLEPHKTPEEKGKDLTERAWEASFTERGLPVPPDGPRDGYWQSELANKHLRPTMGWTEGPKDVPGRLEIDNDGCQYWRSESAP